MSDQIRVLVVDDCAFMRHVIFSQLESDRSIQVIDTARDGVDALEKIRRLKPDVVTLDVEMPRLGGLATLRRTMTECPVPVIMLSNVTIDGADATIHALALGAVDFMAKPSGALPVDIHRTRDELVAKVKQAATTHVSTRASRTSDKNIETMCKRFVPRPASRKQKVVVIGSSTGGPGALHQVVPALPASLDAAVLVVQDMPQGFTRALANRLNDISQLWVKEAEPGDLLTPGLVLVAPGDLHVVVKTSGRIELSREPRVNGARPSVDVTLKSLVPSFGPSCIAVILTGKGHDGTQGARSIRIAGGYVIVEDASTCVAPEMPRHVLEAGAADVIVPLPGVAEEILRAVGSGDEPEYVGCGVAVN